MTIEKFDKMRQERKYCMGSKPADDSMTRTSTRYIRREYYPNIRTDQLIVLIVDTDTQL